MHALSTPASAGPAPNTSILIRGAGVAGLTLAFELARRGFKVNVIERHAQLAGSASWQAGGMLAPWCECETADPVVLELGRRSIGWWDAALPGRVTHNGTLVVAPSRDKQELKRFASRTTGHVPVEGETLAQLEPDLARRFDQGLLFADEAHLDPRDALLSLEAKIKELGALVTFGRQVPQEADNFDLIADCTGRAAENPMLRGVRGEMLVLRTSDITLARPVRLLHPRFPVYVVPRPDHHFMVGATMIESDAAGPITGRSTVELINAAYALHPAFAEAEVVEAGVGIRPAFPDNLPRIDCYDRAVSINGLYRHGFLLAPAMAERAANLIAVMASQGSVAHGIHR